MRLRGGSLLIYLRGRPRRGFTLIEAVVVIVIIVVLTAIIVPSLSGTSSAGSDLAAQHAVTELVDAEVQVNGAGGTLADPGTSAGLSALQQAAPDLTIVTGATTSSGPSTVSAALSGSALAVAAAASNGDCWFALRDFAAAAGSPVTLYATETSGGGAPCSAATAQGLTPNAAAPTQGSSWSDPLTVG